MTLPYPAILLLLAGTLAVATWGVRDLSAERGRRRTLTARSALDGDVAAGGLLARLDGGLLRTDAGRRVARRIASAGLRIRVSTFVALLAAAVAVALVLVGRWIGPVFGVAGAIGVGFLFFSFLGRREDRRKEEFIAQLPELARVLSNATQAGLALRTAIGIAADELDEPAGAELARTVDALKLGQPIDRALRDLGDRLPSRELAVLVGTLVVAARSGGSLITALRGIASTLDQRKEIRRETKTIMGQAVVTNWAVGGMGAGALIMVNLTNPGALRTMSEHLPGQIILAVSAGLFVLSLVIIRRITRIDV